MLGWVGRQLGLVPKAAEKLSGDGVVQFPVNLQSQPQMPWGCWKSHKKCSRSQGQAEPRSHPLLSSLSKTWELHSQGQRPFLLRMWRMSYKAWVESSKCTGQEWCGLSLFFRFFPTTPCHLGTHHLLTNSSFSGGF